MTWEAAPAMGRFMAVQGLAPDLILCSTAARARQTLELVLPDLPRQTDVAYEDGLYLAAASTMLKRIRAVEAGVRHLMLVGHDPGMHGLASELAGSGDPEQLGALAAKFPTAGLAVIVFDRKSWKTIKAGDGRLAIFVTPRRLP